MMTITNFGSGEIQIEDDGGHRLKLNRDSANRLIMAGRMHTVAEFVEKLPALVPDPALVEILRRSFETAATSTDKWNLKEKFARLGTLAKGYVPKDPAEVVETIRL